MTRTNTDRRHLRVKHLPQRTCLACRQVKAKQELVRLVRLADGSVEVDPSGKKSGRGAYLCGVPECWETGLRGDRLERVLHTGLTQVNREQLVNYGKSIQQGVS
ncbi:MAG TPA: YlxR family protein [Dehalococcoidia bacterium]|nr:YlxR family protein [Dehalococcoidia bacterium]